MVGEHRGERDLVVRLEEAAVDDGDVEPVRRERLGRGERRQHHRADGEDRDVAARGAALPTCRTAPASISRHRRRRVGRGVARIAERERAGVVRDAGAQQRRASPSPSFGAVTVMSGHGEHVGDVVQPHVRLAVLADEARAVHAEDDRQRLDRDVVDDVVVRALEERRVDRDDRPHAARRQPGGEGHRVSFGDADVEEPLRMRLRERVGARAARHRRGDRDELRRSRAPSSASPAPKTFV